MNAGAFPAGLARRAAAALEALEVGEVQELLKPSNIGLATNAYTRSRLELRALEHVEYFAARGRKKFKAYKEVGDSYGRSEHTIRKWDRRLREKLGHLTVSRALARARNRGLNAKGAKKDGRLKEFTFHDLWLGEDALMESAKRYQTAVRGRKT